MADSTMTVVGDDVENPANIQTLLVAAEMFGSGCVVRHHAHLARPEIADVVDAERIQVVSSDTIRTAYHPMIALENADDASEIYGSRSPASCPAALIVGNERRGVSRELLTLCDSLVQIPMFSGELNSLNVASATAVALYYLVGDGGGKIRVVSHPEKRRPCLLFLAPSDHVELGSSIRSAAAFGWSRILVEDQNIAWFGVERGARAEGRAAARRARNSIRVIPSSPEQRHAFDRVDVVVPTPGGTPLSRATLASGPETLLVIPDCHGIDIESVDWERFGREIHFVTLDIPHQPVNRRYRLDVSIALAEAARQIGRSRSKAKPTQRGRHLRYDRGFRLHVPELGEVVDFKDLERY